jgi:hypothetical protein
MEKEQLTDQQDIAEACNNYFSFKGDKKSKVENKTIHETFNNAHCYLKQKCIYSSFVVFKTFSTKEISSIIRSMKTKNFHGHDEISTKLLKISSTYICSPLTYICNKAILSGTFPDLMKFSIVKPIFKKGDRKNITNYRPIFLLTSFSRVLKRALYIRLMEHFYINNLFAENQFGFRKGLATEDVIFKLTNKILHSLNNKMMIVSFATLKKLLTQLIMSHYCLN